MKSLIRIKCSNCIHFNACEEWRLLNFDTLNEISESNDKCDYFKDKSRFIELPCKVGDTVYNIEFGLIHGTGRIITPCRVNRIDVSKNEIIIVVNPDKYGSMTYGVHYYLFGTTTFLTREEAEAKLKELECEQE